LIIGIEPNDGNLPPLNHPRLHAGQQPSLAQGRGVKNHKIGAPHGIRHRFSDRKLMFREERGRERVLQ
jgi:hypothetical protein